eukprot:TRINITY_DN3869_c1_g1_i1.p1 TRINITY_DN3869_c1_g1~~TRINITY_DN3869_c1_g1_i1.p1  ORF type:complete len:367 (-),score=161.73 TRINITY_DN3869_c1_g1_i1:150-1196(-)
MSTTSNENITSNPNLEKIRMVSTLSQIFENAQKLWLEIESCNLTSTDIKYQDKVGSAIDKFRLCQMFIDKAAIFSRNETHEDIQTTNLKYILVAFYSGCLELKVSDGIQNRLEHLRKSKTFLNNFLTLCQNFEILNPEDRVSWLREESVDRETKRNELIKRVQREKLANDKIQFLMKKKNSQNNNNEDNDNDCDEEEWEREYNLSLISIAIKRALDELSVSTEEMNMLEQMERLRGPLQNLQPIQTNQITTRNQPPSSLPLERRMIEIKDRMFQPSWTKPIYTVEQAGEIEYRKALEATKRQEEKMKQNKQVDSDDDIDDDEKIKEAREWDDFKDSNPVGWGNRSRTG